MDFGRYNIRCYGICLDGERVLVSYEYHKGTRMLKFPGGGLDLGEGLADCLKREFMEEVELPIEVGSIYYVNPFLQISAFNSQQELLSLYFFVKLVDREANNFADSPWDYQTEEKHKIELRWVRIADLSPEAMTFPIDKCVVLELKKDFGV